LLKKLSSKMIAYTVGKRWSIAQRLVLFTISGTLKCSLTLLPFKSLALPLVAVILVLIREDLAALGARVLVPLRPWYSTD
jgi:hypothetical protein